MLGQHHRAVQHPGHSQVGDERRLTEGLLEPAVPHHRLADTILRLSRGIAVAVALRLCKRRIATQPELFAEEQMASGLGARQVAAVGARFAGGLDRVDDPPVPGAAAQMSIESLGDRVSIRGPVMIDERRGADDDARNAEPALHAAFQHERVTQHATGRVGQTLGRHYVVTLDLLRFSQAGERRITVDQHQAAAAGPFRRASVFDRHDAAFLAQHLEEMHPGLVRRLRRPPIESELDP